MAKKKKAKKKPLAKGKATSSPLTKVQVKGFEETDKVSKNLKVAICVFLMVATFCTYAQIQDHEVIDFDTGSILTHNLNVQAGLTIESFKWVFTKSHLGNWSPVTWLSHMLDYQLYGLHPKGHKLTNLFLHICSALILFIVLLRMTGTLWQSGFVATLFALHPLNVESVVWIAERKNVLSTFFWLMTMWTYFHYADNPTFKRYGLVFLFFTLGLMSKPMLVTLPFVLLLLDYWPLRRLKLGQERDSNEILEKTTTKRSEIFRLVLEKVPLFLLTVGLSIVTVYYQNIAGALKSLDLFPLQVRLANAIVSYLEYLGKMIWPSGLAVFYPHPESSLATWKWVLCFLVLVAITTISIRFIKKAPYFIVGWLWYLGTLVPVIGIIQVGSQAMADRYAYVPLIGIFIIVAWGVPELISKWRYKEKVLSVSGGIIIFLLLITTWKQVSHWKNNITVFEHAVRVTDKEYPSFALIHNNLGNALDAEGKNAEAISHYKMAIELNPNYYKPHTNLGIALGVEGKNEEAISHFKMAIKLKPDYAPAHNGLGIALGAEGKNAEAISHYKMAVKYNPDFADAYNNLGIALGAEGKNEEAISHYKMTIKLKPDYAKAHNNLGNALDAEGKNAEAISHYKMAIKINPDYATAHNNLGNVLGLKGEMKEAISHYKMAIKLNPEYADAHYNLGSVLDTEGKNEEAISHYKMAIKLNPDDFWAHNKLGHALVQKGEMKEAVYHYRETVRLRPDFDAARDNLEFALLQLRELE